nr:hypothetical protein [Tanacetum cinerariifolium]
MNANPLALVATAQPNQDPYYQTPKPHKSYAPTSKASIPTRSHATTINKGKEIAKPITPPSESDSKEDSNPEQAQRDKDMQKNLALIAKYKNDNQSGQFGSQRIVNVAETRENVGSLVVQQSGIQCFICKEFDTNEEIDEQELEAHYSYMAKIQKHCEQSESTSITYFVEQDDSDVTPDSPYMCEHDIQTDQNAEDEHDALANLIGNLKLDVDENKKIQKQLKKENTSLANELEQCKYILAETSKTLKESNSVRDSWLVALQTKQTEFEKYKACNDRTVDYDKLECKLNETLGLLAQKDIEIKEGLKFKAYKISVVKEKHDELVKQSLLTKSHYEGLVKEKIKTQNDSLAFVHELKQEMHADLKYVESLEKKIDDFESDKAEFLNMYDTILQECVFNDVMCTYLHSLSDLNTHTELQCLYLHKVKECEYLALKLSKQTKSVSKEVYTKLLRSFAKLEKHLISLELPLQQCQEQLKNDTVCKEKASNVFQKEREQYFKIQVESSIARQEHRHHLKSRTSNVNAVCATCGKCLIDSDHFACVTKILNDVIAKTKKPNIVQLILFIVDSGCTKHMTGNLKMLCNFVEKYMGFITSKDSITISSRLVNFVMRIWRLISGNLHVSLDIFRETVYSPKDVMIGLPKLKYVKDQLCSSCEVSKKKKFIQDKDCSKFKRTVKFASYGLMWSNADS